MANTADDVVGWVVANWLGWSEDPSSEFIPFQEAWGYPASMEVEWCGGLWCEAVRQTGGTVGPGGTIPNVWSTVAGVRQAIAEGTWIPADGSQGPRRGDLIFFDWQGGGAVYTAADAARVDHVEGCEDGTAWAATGNVGTIGGNISEACGRFTRADDATMVGWIRPRWAGSQAAADGPEAGTTCGYIYRWLRAQGLTLAGAAGVLGNFQQESGFNPSATERGWALDSLARQPGPGVLAAGAGLAQWSYDRLWGPAGLLAFAAGRGTAWNDLNTQLAMVLAEVEARGNFTAMWDRLKQADDAYEAAQDFGTVFEGFGTEGLRNEYAVDIAERAAAGAFDLAGGSDSPTAPPAPAQLPVWTYALGGDDMAGIVFVDVTEDDGSHSVFTLSAAGLGIAADDKWSTDTGDPKRPTPAEWIRCSRLGFIHGVWAPYCRARRLNIFTGERLEA